MGGKPTATPAVTAGRALLVAMAVLAAGLTLTVAHTSPAAAYPSGPGYWLLARDGGVFTYGNSQFEGSTGSLRLNKPIVGGAPYPFYEGYWFVAADGGVFSYGSADFHGSMGGRALNKPVVGMAADPSGAGYWLVATDGGIFSFGTAKFFGSTGSLTLNKPVVGMAATPSGNGYWLVASDGGIFNYGDAQFFGSTGSMQLNQPVVGMAATPSGNGYWLVAADGGIFAFGDAKFFGSTGSLKLNQPVVGMTPTTDGQGYWLVAADGGIFNYGSAGFMGSAGSLRLNQPVVGMMTRPLLAVKVDPFDADTATRTESWETTPGGSQLHLKWDGSGTVPAGASVVGVEGLSVGQLGTLKFTDTSGLCTGNPQFNLYVDTNGDGNSDITRVLTCASGGAGTVKSYDPTTAAGGLSPGGTVVGLDIQLASSGDEFVDDIVAAGISVGDYKTHRSDGSTIG